MRWFAFYLLWPFCLVYVALRAVCEWARGVRRYRVFDPSDIEAAFSEHVEQWDL